MVLSIIICTYNREHFLRLCVDSILNQSEKHQFNKDIEIIIVDNNSKDKTKNIVENFQISSKTKIHYFLEKRQGLSYARNCGVSESKGDFIAFVDDDATINNEWLDVLLRGIKTIDVDVFGGPIFPKFEVECPEWIDKSYFRSEEHTSELQSRRNLVCRLLLEKKNPSPSPPPPPHPLVASLVLIHRYKQS